MLTAARSINVDKPVPTVEPPKKNDHTCFLFSFSLRKPLFLEALDMFWTELPANAANNIKKSTSQFRLAINLFQ